jgi:hypothetical protein
LTQPPTDYVLDPAHSSAEVRAHFAPQLAVARELAEYASALLKRLFVVHSRHSVPDLIVCTALFQQNLTAFDGCVLCLEHGAVDAGHILLRTQFETDLTIDWILKQGKERWARQYYVWNLRQEREWSRIGLAGSAERTKYESDWNTTFGKAPSISPDLAEAAQKRISDIESLLTSEYYAEINGWFETWCSSHRNREPNWHQPGPDAAASISDMAKKLGRHSEYSLVYRASSYRAHGSRSRHGFSAPGEKQVAIEPVRRLDDFPYVCGLACSFALRMFMRLLSAYRPGELPQLRKTYVESWRARLQMPEVIVEPQFVKLS